MRKFFCFVSDPKLPEAVTNTYYEAVLVKEELKKRGYSASIMEIDASDPIIQRNFKKLPAEKHQWLEE